MTAIPMARFGSVQPVAYLSECCHGGCKAPVQFLSFGAEFAVGLCRDHGQPLAEAEAGAPVEWAEPLGHISADEPTEA